VAPAPALALTCRVPYRVDFSSPPTDAIERLIECGALDIELLAGGLAAIIPDAVEADVVARALGVASFVISPAIGRDNGSVWLLRPAAVQIGRLRIVSGAAAAEPGTLRLTDSSAFGSGHHPTTVLCLEALQDALANQSPQCVLDIGTGSGVLALAALMLGAPRAAGLDIDAEALKVAAAHARLNNLADRLELVPGGPDDVKGAWPLVVANVLAAPLIEMAPAIVRRVAGSGRLILSGVPQSLEAEVRRTYERLGMRYICSQSRSGWAALTLQAFW
jgi:ribosomal protein L11 methyltransferase